MTGVQTCALPILEGYKVKGLFIATFPGEPIKKNKPFKEKDKEVKIKLSRHVKPSNIGINDIEIVDKELGILGLKKEIITARLKHKKWSDEKEQDQFEYWNKRYNEETGKFDKAVGEDNNTKNAVGKRDKKKEKEIEKKNDIWGSDSYWFNR